MNLARKLLRRCRNFLPTAGFHFDRPMVLLQSDDWGRVGVRDREGMEQLRSAGLTLGERPYDFYSLETAEDVGALAEVLKRHRDSTGSSPCLQMNLILANLDFARMRVDDFRQTHLLPLAEGLPQGWNRPGLTASYKAGIAEGLFRPALHGSTHFCRSAVERALKADKDRTRFLSTLWQAGTPYIHWRMPWIGYEYWDPEKSEDERFLSAEMQGQSIGQSVGAFAKLFSTLPHSACAPGYRADDNTHRAWALHGIRVAQHGSGVLAPPHFDRHGLLHLCRTVEFEPAVDPAFSLEHCIRCAETCFEQGLPAIVSVHSINFHSTLKDFRGSTLPVLDEFFSVLESKHPDLLYLHDDDVRELVEKGACTRRHGVVEMNVVRRNFTKARLARQGGA